MSEKKISGVYRRASDGIDFVVAGPFCLFGDNYGESKGGMVTLSSEPCLAGNIAYSQERFESMVMNGLLVRLRDADPPALNFSRLQSEHRKWVAYNFGQKGPRAAWEPLLGIGEELGELDHAFLKAHQGVRGTKEEHAAAAKDAIGDIVIYLVDFASLAGYDIQEAVEITWKQVSCRDWIKFPGNGKDK